MKAEMLDRLLALSRTTGDRLVVLEGDTAVVLLPLEKYEDLLGGGAVSATVPNRARPADPVEAANREVAALKEADRARAADTLAAMLDAADDGGEEQFYLEPIE